MKQRKNNIWFVAGKVSGHFQTHRWPWSCSPKFKGL